VFAEAAACATHAVERLRPSPGSSALVVGAGPSGLLLAQLIARAGAAQVTVAARSAATLETARSLGIDRTAWGSTSTGTRSSWWAVTARPTSW
jgi:D-arabinitol dehydrogenase (NADP+)